VWVAREILYTGQAGGGVGGDAADEDDDDDRGALSSVTASPITSATSPSNFHFHIITFPISNSCAVDVSLLPLYLSTVFFYSLRSKYPYTTTLYSKAVQVLAKYYFFELIDDVVTRGRLPGKSAHTAFEADCGKEM